MTNRLFDDLPMIEAHGGVYIDARACQQVWIEDGNRPEFLAEFLKLYPSAYHLSWVQAELGKWVALKHTFNDDSYLNFLEPGKGQGKTDSGINQISVDFFIYMDVKEWINKGYKLVGVDYPKSVFKKLQGIKNLPWKRFFQDKTLRGKKKKTPISSSQIAIRYQRFKNYWEPTGKKIKNCYSFKLATFADGDFIISGPTRMMFNDKNYFGFFRTNPKTGFINPYILFFVP
jgi:hypothetical protein